MRGDAQDTLTRSDRPIGRLRQLYGGIEGPTRLTVTLGPSREQPEIYQARSLSKLSRPTAG
jgi:hypothetical protein